MFPIHRPRRLRGHPFIRDLVRETHLYIEDLVYPMFVRPGRGVREEIPSMPGIRRFSVDTLVEELKEVRDLGIRAILLFGIPPRKDPLGRGAYAKDGIVQRALRAAKKEIRDLILITDICLCEYTSHGHCGLVSKRSDGSFEVDNDRTMELLKKTALSHAEAGAQIVAPSDMMDGRVRAIREVLDGAGRQGVLIMSYAAKYQSAFYGPFREAAESAPQFGDRSTYQMDPAQSREAMKEIKMDVDEGADIVMIKPALPYLDIIRTAREAFTLPIAAYNVSGEYSMVKAAALKGWLDEERVMMEMLLSIKRAGADIIVTYFAKNAARLLIK